MKFEVKTLPTEITEFSFFSKRLYIQPAAPGVASSTQTHSPPVALAADAARRPHPLLLLRVTPQPI